MMIILTHFSTMGDHARYDGISNALGHFATLFIKSKAVSDQCTIGSGPSYSNYTGCQYKQAEKVLFTYSRLIRMTETNHDAGHCLRDIRQPKAYLCHL